jgi:signal transduction histidine kinase/ActR/RegA family two-component response regulator
MPYDTRDSGISAVGEISWGTHFCQFYRTKEDLAETLVPYFEAGLRANESCLWVTSERLEADIAEDLMVRAMPDFKRHLHSGQMQILSIKDWYTPGKLFSADDVLQGWIDKEAQSKAKGLSGLRLTGDTFWVERSGWNDFMEYENKVNQAFRQYNLVALCTYCMDKCSAEDVIDVCCHHQFALARRKGHWELLESSSLKIAKENLHQLNMELESRVNARTAELNNALMARDEFLAMLGHELRNPLAPIRNATEIIRALTPPDSPISSSTAILDRQVSHMTRLVDDLLDVARITQGQINLDTAIVSLSEVIEQSIELSRPLIDQRGHSFSVSLPSRHVKVQADASRLAQVFGNLLHNAAKYTPDGGNVSIATSIDGGIATITVQDTGSGIPGAMLGSIFDLFKQLPRSLARSDGGLGIGLTLVKRITEMHGGTVTASSNGSGRGAAFAVRLPLAEVSVPERFSSPTRAVNKPAAGRRVVIIDDNHDSNQTLAMLLEIAGHEVESAYDGPSGLALVNTVAPDAIVLDIGLPGMDGYEVAAHLRGESATKDTFIVALTGYGQACDVVKARQAGFDAHLLKPARMDEMLKLIANLPKNLLH